MAQTMMQTMIYKAVLRKAFMVAFEVVMGAIRE